MAALRTRVLGRSSTAVCRDLVRPRLLATSSPARLPRTPFRPRTLASVSPSPLPIDPPDHGTSSSFSPPGEDPSESSPSPTSTPSSSSPPADPPRSFPAIVTELITPDRATEPLSPENHVLFNHLHTTFLPSNQLCADLSAGAPHSHLSHNHSHSHSHPLVRDNHLGKMVVLEDIPEPMPEQDDDLVVALVCPFEGGDAYIRQSVVEVASHLAADVVRLDLPLGVGLDGPFAPLKETGIAAPPLPHSINPLLFSPSERPPDAAQQQAMEEEAEEDGDDGAFSANVIRIPMVGMTAVPGGGGGGAAPFFSSNSGGRRRGGLNEEWVAFFSTLINMQLPEGAGATANRRIILLEQTAAMADTFELWWPSLLEAVRRRRRGPVSPASRTKGRKSPPPVTTQPTTIVLSVPPSLLLPHTAEPGGPVEHQDHHDDVESTKDRLRSLVEQIGASVSHIHVEDTENEAKPWWGSEEHDHEGRRKREVKRLRALYDNGPSALLPSFTNAANKDQGMGGHPILQMLAAQVKRGAQDEPRPSPVWKTLAVVPSKRDIELERHERTRRRRAINAALMTRAVGELGATLEEPLAMLDAPGSAPWRGRKKRLQRRKEPDPEWSEAVIAWNDAVDLASTAVGQVASLNDLPPPSTPADSAAAEATPSDSKAPLIVKWEDIQGARGLAAEHEHHLDETVSQYLSASDSLRSQVRKERRKSTTDTPVSDPVVDGVRKAKDLTKHEKRLVNCIVDPAKLATASFRDVHLPFKTIDGIRSVISLPLLFPDAFQGGILKDHVTSGALLFGPPGTGKTLLARAIAAESGARMLAIQPSDVNDMWVGEGEKLVKAVFSLARRLSPCVVFIDEVDSLFGARSAKDASGGSKAHNQVLTEFMQEMDGLSSAIANKDKRIVVVGATNRPFDLDDAILRRLPRRLLVDLPTVEDRKAIINILLRDEHIGADVDVDKIAAETEGFSGSDLKHLCVAAALAAVKEMINVPWKSGAGSQPAQSLTPPRHFEGGDGPSPRNDIPIAVEETQPTEELPKEKVELTTADASTPVGSEPELSPAGKVLMRAHEQRLDAEAGLSAEAIKRSAVSSAPSSSLNSDTAAAEDAVRRHYESESDSESASGSSDSSSSPASHPASAQNRVLHARHFKIALGEIRPSSSEEGTLPELRKWAEMYGEGGKQKGKKSGFGKGFGFGDLGGKREKGYGRVEE